MEKNEKKDVPHIQEGPPIWVESCMSAEEWRVRYQSGLRTSNKKEPPQYNASYYKGGRWRFGMGSTPSLQEMERRNTEIESLKQFHLSQQETV